MPLKLQTVYTRPNADVPWHFDVPVDNFEVRKYIQDNFIATGKLKVNTRVASADGLEITVESEWDSKESKDTFTQDPFILTNRIIPETQYNQQNNINKKINVLEE